MVKIISAERWVLNQQIKIKPEILNISEVIKIKLNNEGITYVRNFKVIFDKMLVDYLSKRNLFDFENREKNFEQVNSFMKFLDKITRETETFLMKKEIFPKDLKSFLEIQKNNLEKLVDIKIVLLSTSQISSVDEIKFVEHWVLQQKELIGVGINYIENNMGSKLDADTVRVTFERVKMVYNTVITNGYAFKENNIKFLHKEENIRRFNDFINSLQEILGILHSYEEKEQTRENLFVFLHDLSGPSKGLLKSIVSIAA